VNKESKIDFDQLKNTVSKTITVLRKQEYIGLGNVQINKPFTLGEKFSKLHPHQTLDGKKHKGNVKVVQTSIIGSQAIAKCVLPNCNETVLLKAEEKQ